LQKPGSRCRSVTSAQPQSKRLGRLLPRTTLKAALAPGVAGDSPRFRHVRYDVYELA
jgi:hypothetical protein